MHEDGDRPDGGTFMCARCTGDAELGAFVRENAISMTCSFCNRESSRHPIAADADVIAQRIANYVEDEWEDAAECVPYESAEGGYQARTLTADELLYEE